MPPKDKTYNGHKNWNHWNVSLWINNDESLYKTALFHIKKSKNLDHAARLFLQDLEWGGNSKTPDGAPYTFTTVRAALAGLKED